jgi:hypothetical protein
MFVVEIAIAPAKAETGNLIFVLLKTSYVPKGMSRRTSGRNLSARTVAQEAFPARERVIHHFNRIEGDITIPIHSPNEKYRSFFKKA